MRLIDIPGFAGMSVVAVAFFNHCIWTTFTWVMTFIGKLGLVKSKGEIVDSVSHLLFPVQMGKLLTNDEEYFSQFVISDGLQINFLSDSTEELIVGYAECVDVAIDP